MSLDSLADSSLTLFKRLWRDFTYGLPSFLNMPDSSDLMKASSFTECEVEVFIDFCLKFLVSNSSLHDFMDVKIKAYYFIISLLMSNVPIGEESTTSFTASLHELVLKKLFELLDTIVSVFGKQIVEQPHLCLQMPSICGSLGLLSDVLRDCSSLEITTLLLRNLQRFWCTFGIIIKEVIKHMLAHYNGSLTDEQDVFIYDVMRLWRCSVKTLAKHKFPQSAETDFSSVSFLIDLVQTCLVDYPAREWSQRTSFIDLINVSSNTFLRTLRSLVKFIYNSELPQLNTFRPTLDTLLLNLFRGFYSTSDCNQSRLPCSPLFNTLAQMDKLGKQRECVLFESNHNLVCRLLFLCGLDFILHSDFDNNKPTLLCVLKSLHATVLLTNDSGQGDSTYENCIINLLTGNDSHLFYALNQCLKLEEAIVLSGVISQEEPDLLKFIPNSHWLFAYWAHIIGYAPYLIVDWLISPETECLSYFVHYLRQFRSKDFREALLRQPWNVSPTLIETKKPMALKTWPSREIQQMLKRISRCLQTMDEHKGIAFSPTPLIRSIDCALSIMVELEPN